MGIISNLSIRLSNALLTMSRLESCGALKAYNGAYALIPASDTVMAVRNRAMA
jgi:hypothetical protein